MSAQQYDSERDVTWRAVLFDTNREFITKETAVSYEEINADMIAKVAKTLGYDCFEIVRTETETKRYTVREVAE